ncbi:hypothetical protein MASR1M65_02570 [Saprospiraceae bacterium]
MKKLNCALLIVFTLLNLTVSAQKKSNEKKAVKETVKDEFLEPGTYSGLSFRSIGPAVTSGRIADFAVVPSHPEIYYIASASGGVWKTTNKGTTFEPIFDSEGSYSIGCVTLDPSNSNVVWVGTGENHNQRSVAYGDGVYKSEDGGKSWTNMGLKNSEHISNIIVDPTDPRIIYVGAYGPVWKEGGERGVYKSTDGGTSWSLVKSVSQYTGCNNLVMDPRDPKVLYAAFHQRMRKVFTYIGGGPESALYKSTDGGVTWKKLEGGLPGGDVGRIGIAIAPSNPDVLYAVVEAKDGKGGIYRSSDRGASWTKQSGVFTSGNYYQEVDVDPKNENRIFITDTYNKVSDDGGKTVRNLGEINKHVDNHAIWIDPNNTDHLLVGCDGGIYETYDFAKTWEFKSNLPVTQFYKVSTDNAVPFYNVHGGTQDNFSLGGPSRNISANGIVNSDWIVTSVGDGFETQVDPTNPDIIYAQSQYGGLVRFDRKSGQYLNLKPSEKKGEAPLRWNWDAPLLISSHDPSRLYFGANVLFRTDNKGQEWRAISPDLSRQSDRNKFEVMGMVQSVDAIAKNQSTDIYGQLTTIAESRIDPDILYTGTDDGLIQITTDGGKTWTKIDNIPGAPTQSYVHQIITSWHDKNTAYACFNHHRYGDFKPYIFKTVDGGKSWKSISANLPERGSVYSIAEDHVDAGLLFVGTEFGVFFSKDGGSNWIQLKAGLPTIAVRDIEIQRRENDLVLATFGRGFYILDDYSPLRNFKRDDFNKSAKILPVKDAWMYIESTPLGLRDKGHLGSGYFSAQNPPVGAVFSYYLKESIKTIKEKRQETEKTKKAKGETFYYPSMDSLYAEDNQLSPYLRFTIKDASGNIVRYLTAPAKKGLARIVWDFRYGTPAPSNQRYTPAPDQLFSAEELGHLALPGTYTVTLEKFEDGNFSVLDGPVNFVCKSLNNASLPATDLKEYSDFCTKVSKLRRAVSAGDAILSELKDKILNFDIAVKDMPTENKALIRKISDIKQELTKLDYEMNGDATLARREFESSPSINGRVSDIEGSMWSVTSAPTETFKTTYTIAAEDFGKWLEKLKTADQAIRQVELELNAGNAPATPGRWPQW